MYQKILSFGFPILLGLVIFQNCGEMSSTAKNQMSLALEPEGSDNNLEENLAEEAVVDEIQVVPEDLIVDEEVVVETPAMFAAGETVALDKLPFPLSSTQLPRLGQYLNSTVFRMIGFTRDGESMIHIDGLARDQAEATRVGLERCQILYRKPCSLYAEANIITRSRVDFFNNFNNLLMRSGVFNALEIPVLNRVHQESIQRSYKSNTYEAVSIGLGGAVNRGWSGVSQADANRRSLEFCEILHNEPCTLYAVDTQIVFNFDTFQWSPRLVDYAPSMLTLNRIPFISDSDRVANFAPVVQAINQQNRQFVIALSRYGHWGITPVLGDGAITDAARARALDLCTAKITSPANPGSYQHRCFVYSENNQVVLTRRQIEVLALGRN